MTNYTNKITLVGTITEKAVELRTKNGRDYITGKFTLENKFGSFYLRTFCYATKKDGTANKMFDHAQRILDTPEGGRINVTCRMQENIYYSSKKDETVASTELDVQFTSLKNLDEDVAEGFIEGVIGKVRNGQNGPEVNINWVDFRGNLHIIPVQVEDDEEFIDAINDAVGNVATFKIAAVKKVVGGSQKTVKTFRGNDHVVGGFSRTFWTAIDADELIDDDEDEKFVTKAKLKELLEIRQADFDSKKSEYENRMTIPAPTTNASPFTDEELDLFGF